MIYQPHLSVSFALRMNLKETRRSPRKRIGQPSGCWIGPRLPPSRLSRLLYPQRLPIKQHNGCDSNHGISNARDNAKSWSKISKVWLAGDDNEVMEYIKNWPQSKMKNKKTTVYEGSVTCIILYLCPPCSDFFVFPWSGACPTVSLMASLTIWAPTFWWQFISELPFTACHVNQRQPVLHLQGQIMDDELDK